MPVNAVPGTLTTNTLTILQPPTGDVVINGTAGDDSLLLELTPGGVVGSVTYILNNNPPVSLSGVTSFTFDGLGGNDTMTVSKVNGGPLVPGIVHFDGGAGNNTLVVDAAGAITRESPGLVAFGDPQNLTYVNVSTININHAASVVAVAGPNTADRATALVGLTAQERFVQNLYLAELGRAGSTAELDGWVTVLNTSGAAAVAADIQHSFEAEDHLVRTWYVAFMGRQAQGGEEQGWVGRLQQGQSEEQALSQILASPEFYARAQTLVSSGTADQPLHPGALSAAAQPDPGEPDGAAGWLNALPSLGRQGVAMGFLISPEFRADQFEGYYNALLHRPDDQPSLNTWVFSALNIEDVRISFEATPEFFVDG